MVLNICAYVAAASFCFLHFRAFLPSYDSWIKWVYTLEKGSHPNKKHPEKKSRQPETTKHLNEQFDWC